MMERWGDVVEEEEKEGRRMRKERKYYGIGW